MKRNAAVLLVSAGLMGAAAGAASASQPTAWNLADMDLSCSACTDFYRFANGAWLDRNTIPADRTRWSSYDEANDRTRQQLKAILSEAVEAARNTSPKSDLTKLGVFYRTCNDLTLAERQGVDPIKSDLMRIAGMSDGAELQPMIEEIRKLVPDLLFWYEVEADQGPSRRTILNVHQAGLSLGDAEPYLDKKQSSLELVEHLRTSATRMFQLTGDTPAQAAANADRVVALESQLAAASVSPTANRDQVTNYNLFIGRAANRLTPHWDWSGFVRRNGGPEGPMINLAQRRFFVALDQALAGRPIEDWKAYLRWHLIRETAPWLSTAFSDASLAFTGRLTGAQASLPRQEQCLNAVNSQMGEALGKIYLKRTFTPDAQTRAARMVDNLKTVMAERIDRQAWLSPQTRAKAKRKLADVKVLIGGPTRWMDYGPLQVSRESFVENMRRSSELLTRHNFARINKLIDREDWYILPQFHAASADLPRNMMMFPAGQLQFPFFDPLADDALNYGSIGGTIGHELTHLFDDRGRKYDPHGVLREWWKPEEVAEFNRRASRVREQFDSYEMEGQRLNGVLTISENIADLSGLTIAFYALQRELQGRQRLKIDGFGPEQRFFLAWARQFRGMYRPERQRALLRTNPHAPFRFRVIGPLSNMAEFSSAFACREGDAMVRVASSRAQIW